MRLRHLYALIVFLLFICRSKATLSKSDKKTKKNAEHTDSKKIKPELKSPTIDVGLTKESIIRDNSKLDRSSKKQFGSTTLAYVTPWNNLGYDIAKWQAHKFDIIVPVWFQVLPSTFADQSCDIRGEHDIDRGWIADVRKGNDKIKIIPRMNFEHFQAEQINDLLTDQFKQMSCAQTIADFIHRNQFDGATVEMWLMFMAMTRGQNIRNLLTFIISLAELLKSKNLITVLPVSPSLSEDGKTPTGILLAEHFTVLLPYIDYFSVMTYDFTQRQVPGPISPIDWQQANIEYLLSSTDDRELAASKLLMGINMYGYSYEQGQQPNAIIGNRYLQMLEQKDAQLIWDNNFFEHILKTKSQVTYYPSIVSLQARFAMADKLAVGLSFWDIGQGLNYFYNLL